MMKLNNKLKKNFSVIPNDLIRDTNLSQQARFLFVYLASHDDNWTYYNDIIESVMMWSKNTRVKYMKELADAGWIEVRQAKKPDGSWAANEIILNFSPHTKKEDTGVNTDSSTVYQKSGGGKIGTHKNTNLKKKTNNINICTSEKEKKASKTVEERRADFKKEVVSCITERYDAELAQDFYVYWSESSKGGKKMRFEKERTFGIKNRLYTFWKNREERKKKKERL